jgi:hypothetical protein
MHEGIFFSSSQTAWIFAVITLRCLFPALRLRLAYAIAATSKETTF